MGIVVIAGPATGVVRHRSYQFLLIVGEYQLIELPFLEMDDVLVRIIGPRIIFPERNKSKKGIPKIGFLFGSK